MDDCIFCKIAAGKLPVQTLAESDRAMAFPDLRPQAPVHALVIPRVHVASLKEAADFGLIGHLHELAVRVAREKGLLESGFRTVLNTGPDAGQTVFHLHLHLLGGRPMEWPPG